MKKLIFLLTVILFISQLINSQELNLYAINLENNSDHKNESWDNFVIQNIYSLSELDSTFDLNFEAEMPTFLETVPPVFENSTPSSSSVLGTSFTLNVDINEAGVIYYVVVADGAGVPTSLEVKAGTGSGGSGQVTSGNATVTVGGFTHAFNVSGLVSETAYDIYILAEDDEALPNLQVSPTKVDVTMADITPPTVLLSTITGSPINLPFTITIAFSEIITNFDITDITASNGSVSGFNLVDATTYTAIITPTADGDVVVSIAAGVLQDVSTNANDNLASNVLILASDLTKPIVAITTAMGTDTHTNASSFTTTFTFSEDMADFEEADLVIANATISNFVSVNDALYTATITPIAEGLVTIDLPADTIEDNANNGNVVATQYSIIYDITRPTVIISTAVVDPINTPFTATFTFDEGVTGFDMSDIEVENGTVSAFNSTSASIYTATITPTISGNVTIDVSENVAQDVATNGNDAATQYSILYDITAPTVVITTMEDSINTSFTATFTFNEDVTGFDIGDITVGNGVASDFVMISASVYTALITPAVDGQVTIDITAGLLQDIATNLNTVATQFTIEYDTNAPTVTISTTAVDPINTSFTATFTFNEDVAGFDIGDITVGNGIASDFTMISASVYTVLITPAVDGQVTIDIAAGLLQDIATNLNTAAAQFIIEYDGTRPVKPQVTHISDYTCTGNINITGDNTLMISGIAERGSTVEVFIGGSSIGTTTVSNTGFFTFDYTSTTLADGNYSITVTATDTANNTSILSDPLTIIINSLDTDGDGLPDFCDDDDDGNGVDDGDEDCDGDGIVDHLDSDNSSCSNTLNQTKSYGFSPNGDGVNEGWVIENIIAYPNSVVQVFNRSGKLVFKKKGYQNDWTGISNQISSNGLGAKLPVGPYLFIVDLGDGSKPTRGWLYINY